MNIWKRYVKLADDYQKLVDKLAIVQAERDSARAAYKLYANSTYGKPVDIVSVYPATPVDEPGWEAQRDNREHTWPRHAFRQDLNAPANRNQGWYAAPTDTPTVTPDWRPIIWTMHGFRYTDRKD